MIKKKRQLKMIPLALMEAAGSKVSFDSLASEVGNTDSKWATNQSAKETLPSVEKLSEQIWQDSEMELDQTEIRNQLIDIINSFGSVKEVQQAVIDIYGENKAKIQKQELNAFLGSLSEKELASIEYQMAEDAYLSELSVIEIKQYYEKQYGTEQERRSFEAENGLDVRESNQEPTGNVDVSNEKESQRGAREQTEPATQPATRTKAEAVEPIVEQPTKSKIKDVFNQDNIKDDLDWLDSLKIDPNNLNSTLPFLPQVFNALIDAVKVVRMAGNSPTDARNEIRRSQTLRVVV